MSADLFEDSFPHGTVAGYQQGCKGGSCPAGEEYGLSCRTAKSMAAGDYQYRKLVARGKSVAEISAELGLVGTHTIAAPAAPKKKPAPLPVEPVPAAAPEPEVEVVPVATKSKTEASPREIRAWARDRGIDVPAKGTLPRVVVEAYEQRDTIGDVTLTIPVTVPPVPTAVIDEPAATKCVMCDDAVDYVSSRGWCDGCEEYDAQSEATLVAKAPDALELATATVTTTADDTADWSLGLTASDLRVIAEQLDHLDRLDLDVIAIDEIPVRRPDGSDIIGSFTIHDPGSDPWFGFVPAT